MIYDKKTPLLDDDIENLKVGDVVYLSGTVYTSRDAAHERIVHCLENGEKLPYEVAQTIVYYVGPTPAKKGEIIGSCGPTSSYRMDKFALPLLKHGQKVMIGKGPRSKTYRQLLIQYHGLYLSAIGGTALKISKCVKSCRLIAYDDLGPEAIYQLEVENMMTIVTYDAHGNSLFTNDEQNESME